MAAEKVLHDMLSEAGEKGLPEGVYLQVCDALKTAFQTTKKIVNAYDLDLEFKLLNDKDECLCVICFKKIIIRKENEEEEKYDWNYTLQYSIVNPEENEEEYMTTGDTSVISTVLKMYLHLNDWQKIKITGYAVKKELLRETLLSQFHTLKCSQVKEGDKCYCHKPDGTLLGIYASYFESHLTDILTSLVRNYCDVKTGIDDVF